jgi:hypothetical protein
MSGSKIFRDCSSPAGAGRIRWPESQCNSARW